MLRGPIAAAAAVAACCSAAPLAAQPHHASSIRALIEDPRARIVVVAHRGCHNGAPGHGLDAAPENSLLALEHCVVLGADMMETDVRMTADGYLVIMHDDTVDRTTNGRGPVAEMTLAELRQLRLRQNLGGYDQPVTDQRVLTLDELLQAARGRIFLNLDVKAAIYAEVVDAVIRAGDDDSVIVKAPAGAGSPALAAVPPYDRVPFMPILSNAGAAEGLERLAERQATDARPVALELPRMPVSQLPGVRSAALRHHLRLFANTLGDGFIAGVGGDNAALTSPDAVWGSLYRQGITIFQTDRPEALLAFRGRIR